MEPSGFQILFEEGPCLVLNKPAGLLTQAPPGIDSLEVRVRRFLQQREGKAHQLYLGVPHRLDRPVSGAIVLARHVRAARRLSEQFEQRTVQKKYWALVEGRVAEASGTWIDWMRKVPNEPRSENVPEGQPDGQRAVLHFRVLEWRPDTTWLEIELETGRTHQIRVQCASRGHAVWGDAQYGATRPFGPSCDDPRDRWIALHARHLAFAHPMHRGAVSIDAPLPEGWPVPDFPTQPFNQEPKK